MKACLVLLLALSAGALVHARVFQDDGHSSRSLAQIQLGASAYCPDGCDRVNGGCVQDNTMAGLRCQDCLGNLLVNKVTGNCTCPAGKYADKANNCVDCPKGKYCSGGAYSISKSGEVLAPLSAACPNNMTTVGRRSVTIRACVQDPGFSYSINTDGTLPSATLCPPNTYSAGLKKQRACVPCPTGFITDPSKPDELRTSPTQCRVPAGYYLKAPGQVAACPQGEYKEGLATGANCTKCAFGVTTATEGSTSRWNCTILLPGYYAAEMNTTTNTVLRVAICPQGYYCPGGAPNATFVPTPLGRRLLQAPGSQIIKCPFDAWTQEPGATSIEQCLVPPGYYYDTTSGTVVKCEPGEFRADWLSANLLAAQSCIKCGDGVKAATTDLVKAYNVTDVTLTWFEEVTTSSDDCYIEAGQALYYESLTQRYRAVNCDDDNYGVSNRTYGWTPTPCKACPNNMVAINNATYSQSALYFTNSTDGSAYGFTSPMACVTINGYGYNSRVAQACQKGYYNALNNREDCKPCGYGLTTAGVGLGFVEGDCGIAPGFGYDGSTIRECPIGTYNSDAIDPDRKAPCTACPVGLTTQGTGSTNSTQCNLCAIGYGGYQCNTTCGGDISPTTTGSLYPGTYGNDGRAWIETDPTLAACTECTKQETGYSFSWQFTNDNYSVPSISPVMANASTDCLAKYSQTLDGAWYMPDTPNAILVYTNIATFAECVKKCDEQKIVDADNSPGCQWVTYDYVAQNCSVRFIGRQIYVGAPVVGFKAVPSGDVGTNAWSMARSAKVKSLVDSGMDQASAKALASGRYTFYQDPYALEIGNWTVETEAGTISGQKSPDGVDDFTKWQDCLNACDDDYLCTAFIIRLTVIVGNRPKTCRLVYGRKDVGEFKRTFVRADISRLNDISGNLNPENNQVAG